MKLLQLGACALGQHRRDRKRAWFDGEVYRSYCSGCGTPMISEPEGWKTTKAHPTPPPSRKPRASKPKSDKPSA